MDDSPSLSFVVIRTEIDRRSKHIWIASKRLAPTAFGLKREWRQLLYFTPGFVACGHVPVSSLKTLFLFIVWFLISTGLFIRAKSKHGSLTKPWRNAVKTIKIKMKCTRERLRKGEKSIRGATESNSLLVVFSFQTLSVLAWFDF